MAHSFQPPGRQHTIPVSQPISLLGLTTQAPPQLAVPAVASLMGLKAAPPPNLAMQPVTMLPVCNNTI